MSDLPHQLSEINRKLDLLLASYRPPIRVPAVKDVVLAVSERAVQALPEPFCARDLRMYMRNYPESKDWCTVSMWTWSRNALHQLCSSGRIRKVTEPGLDGRTNWYRLNPAIPVETAKEAQS